MLQTVLQPAAKPFNLRNTLLCCPQIILLVLLGMEAGNLARRAAGAYLMACLVQTIYPLQGGLQPVAANGSASLIESLAANSILQDFVQSAVTTSHVPPLCYHYEAQC